MKKLTSVILSAILITSALLVSCEKTSNQSETSQSISESVTSIATTAPQISETSSEQSISMVENEAVETDSATENPTETEPATEEPIEAGIDLNDAANLPLRLVGMTFAEIEAEFGPLECPYMMYGGSPVYTSEKLPGIRIVYISADSTLDNGWHAAAPYETPDRIDVGGGEYYIYPGIYIGMPVEELVRVINDYKVTNAHPLRETTYDIMATINDTYGFCATFKIPSEMYYGFLDYYDSVKNDIDPQYGYAKLVDELEEKLANNLSGELLGYSIYG